MWNLVCSLPVEITAVHILPMLGLKDLVAVDTSCVKKYRSWQEALQVMKPIKLDGEMMNHVRAAEWILRSGIQISQFSCTFGGPEDRQLRLAEAHLSLLKKIQLRLLHCGGFNRSQQVSQSVLQKTVTLEMEGVPTPSMTKAIMTGVTHLQRLICSDDDNYQLVQNLLKRNPRLRSVSLHDFASLKGFRLGSNLTSLSFHVTHMTGKQATDIAGTCSNLTTLWIGVGCVGHHLMEGTHRDDLITPFAEHCPELRSLTYLCFDITSTAVWAIAKHCRHLGEYNPPREITAGEILIFALHRTPLSDVEFSAPLVGWLHQYQWLLRRLRRAKLHTRFIKSKDSVEAVRCMTNLRHIHLDCTGWRMFPLLEGIAERCHNLVSLEIRHEAGAVQEICRVLHYCRQLQDVSLTCTATVEVTQLLVLSLTQLGPQLQRLHLLQFLAHDAVLLPILAANPNLRSLALCHITTADSDDIPQITDATLRALTHCRKLSSLILSNGPQVTPEAVLYLLRTCRHLQDVLLPHGCESPSDQLIQLAEDYQTGRRIHKVAITNADA